MSQTGVVKSFHGIKYMIPYDQETLQPLGVFKVIGAVDLVNEIELNKLEGGHSNGPHKIEPGPPNPQLTATLKEFPEFWYELLENANVTNTTAEILGYVSALKNAEGTSVFSAAAGIESVTPLAGSEGNIPFGRLIFKAASATTVDIYVAGDPSGTGLSEDGLMEAGVIVADAATTDVLSLGIQILGGTTVGMTVDDTAAADARSPNSESNVIAVGADNTVREFGVMLIAPKQSDGIQYTADIPRVTGMGIGFMGESRAFSEKEYTLPVMPCTDPDTQVESLYTVTNIKHV